MPSGCRCLTTHVPGRDKGGVLNAPQRFRADFYAVINLVARRDFGGFLVEGVSFAGRRTARA